ncbi:MAG: HDOD domain-containing protein [candidate division Zixibacteria bacterium]|nr:HDOD domain-containing protein [candidate division Zixibacteria bacterium]
MTRDENSSAGDLSAVIMKDPALAARLLRIVNSAYYGLGRQIGSITQAVMAIGMRQVTALALSSSVYRMTDNWRSPFDRKAFWRHSLEVARGARLIAEKIGFRNLEEPWMVGLLHDIGILVLERSYPRDFARLWALAQREEALEDLEVAEWNTDHARVGQFLLQQWNLPEEICSAVRYHHTTFVSNDTDPERRLAQLIALAHLMSRSSIGKSLPPTESDVEQKEILAANLGISTEALRDVERKTFSRTISEAQYLEIDIGSTEDLLAEANRQLIDQYLTLESVLRENRQMQKRLTKDQVSGADVDSVRQSTLVFAQYMSDAADIISVRADAVRAAIESGAIVDPKGLVAMSVQGILAGLAAVRTLVSEILAIASPQISSHADPDYLRAVELRIKKQLASIEDVHADSPVGIH